METKCFHVRLRQGLTLDCEPGLPGWPRLTTSPPVTCRTDDLTAPNKVLNLRVTHFLSDDANDRESEDEDDCGEARGQHSNE
jgi:hypothetical protein